METIETAANASCFDHHLPQEAAMKHATTILAAIFSAPAPRLQQPSDDSGAQPVASSGVGSVLVSVTPSVPLVATSAPSFAARRCRGRGAPYNAASSTFSYRFDVTTGALRVTHANAAFAARVRDIRAGFRPSASGEHHHRARAAAGGGRRGARTP